MKRLSALRSVTAIAACILSACALAQAGPNVFGATIRNPGSVMPEWWNEREYIPPQLNGAMHLRVGSAGSMGGTAVPGRSNCDMALLYAAKSGKPLNEGETDFCALMEFALKKGIVGDRRNPNDPYVRKDVIAEMRPVLKARMDEMAAATRFYFRAAAVRIDKVDPAQNTAVVAMNTQSGWVGDPVTATYRFDGLGFTDRANPTWWMVTLRNDEANNRLLASALMRGGGVPSAFNDLSFRVVDTRELRQGSQVERLIRIEVEKVNFSVRDAQNNLRSLGVALSR